MVLYETLDYFSQNTFLCHIIGTFSIIIIFVCIEPDLLISGQYQNLRVGSATVINCTALSVADNMIRWLSHSRAVVSSSGTLILQSVDSTNNGTAFTCLVTSPHLTESINQTIVVTVQGSYDNNSECVLSAFPVLFPQQHQLLNPLLSIDHYMLLMVTRMLNCSVLSH